MFGACRTTQYGTAIPAVILWQGISPNGLRRYTVITECVIEICECLIFIVMSEFIVIVFVCEPKMCVWVCVCVKISPPQIMSDYFVSRKDAMLLCIYSPPVHRPVSFYRFLQRAHITFRNSSNLHISKFSRWSTNNLYTLL